jgi:hypothetical protein
MKKILPLAALFAFGLACQPTSAPIAKTDEGEDVKVEAKVEDIGPELKHSGADFLGLKEPGTLTYKFSQMEGLPPERGEETTTLVEAGADKAVFDVTRTNALMLLGSETVEVRKDGVYIIKTSLGELKTPALSMPADVKPGAKWTSSLELTRPNGDVMTMSTSYEALREEKITVEAGEFDSLVISGKGEIKVTPKDGAASTTPWTSTVWHAKGIGHIRMSQEAKNAEGKPVKQYMELVKEGKDDKPAADGA